LYKEIYDLEEKQKNLNVKLVEMIKTKD